MVVLICYFIKKLDVIGDNGYFLFKKREIRVCFLLDELM